MGAPAGNEFWKMQSKYGRDKIFGSPEIMWEAACEYFQWCIDNPRMVAEVHGKDAELINVPKKTVFTMVGLCRHLCVNDRYFYKFKEQLPEGEKAFSEIITRIEGIIYEEKYSGGMIGQYNPNMVMRDLGLTDKTATTNLNTNINTDVAISVEDARAFHEGKNKML